MSTKNVTLHDENGNILLPATKTSRVTDANGTNLDTLLQQAGQVKSVSVNGTAQTIDANGNIELGDVSFFGDTVGNVTTADFNAQTDTVWNKTQVLGSTQQATARSNINAQETLVSGTNIKTINNISILGSGNINTSGGGSSTVQEVNHGTSDTTFTLTPNVFHVWGTVSSLTLTLGTGESGVMNEYMFQFSSGSTATTLSLPSSVKWITDSTISANKTYQVSILNNLAVMGGA